jgi:Pyridoxamine 5'-phosphate oxidase
VEEWLVKARTYWLTTTCPDGRPHAVPLWGVWHDGTLGFSTGAGTATSRNLALNKSALAHPGNGDQVAIIEGAVEGFADRAALAEFVAQYQRKYNWAMDPDAPPGPIYRLAATRVLSWDADVNLVQTMVRWEFSG